MQIDAWNTIIENIYGPL